MRLEWYVFIENPNAKKFEEYNCLKGWEERIIEEYKKTKNKKEFLKRLDLILMSRYWSRCEYEMILVGWPNDEIKRKIDIYEQIKLNWKHFSEYVWEWVKENG